MNTQRMSWHHPQWYGFRLFVEMKRCLVTGATSGIGLSMTIKLLKAGSEVILVGRDPELGKRLHLELSERFGNPQVHFFCADLSKRSEVIQLGKTVLDKFEILDVLINNAACVSTQRKLTEDGNELQFAVNYLAPVLLTHQLLPALLKSEQGRIVNVSSRAHGRGKLFLNDLSMAENYSLARAYNQSKLAIMHFSMLLSQLLRETNITVNSFHPGLVNTDIGSKNTGLIDNLGWWAMKNLGRSAEKAAEDGVYLSLSDSVKETTGGYFHNKTQIAPSKKLNNKQDKDELWKQTLRNLNIPVDGFIKAERSTYIYEEEHVQP